MTKIMTTSSHQIGSDQNSVVFITYFNHRIMLLICLFVAYSNNYMLKVIYDYNYKLLVLK